MGQYERLPYLRHGAGAIVRYFDIAGVPAWFGTDYRLWEQFDSPLWLGLQSHAWEVVKDLRSKLRHVKESLGEDYKSDVEYFNRNEDFVRINLPAGVEHAEGRHRHRTTVKRTLGDSGLEDLHQADGYTRRKAAGVVSCRPNEDSDVWRRRDRDSSLHPESSSTSTARCLL